MNTRIRLAATAGAFTLFASAQPAQAAQLMDCRGRVVSSALSVKSNTCDSNDHVAPIVHTALSAAVNENTGEGTLGTTDPLANFSC